MEFVKVKLANGKEIECFPKEAESLEKAGKLFKKEEKTSAATKENKEVKQRKTK